MHSNGLAAQIKAGVLVKWKRCTAGMTSRFLDCRNACKPPVNHIESGCSHHQRRNRRHDPSEPWWQASGPPALDIFIEKNVGQDRCGVDSDADVVRLAEMARDLPGASWKLEASSEGF